MNVVIFGIGKYGTKFVRYCKDNQDYHVVAAIDNRCAADQEFVWQGIKTVNPAQVGRFDFDKVIITVYDEKIAKKMKSQLLGGGVAEDKIACMFEIQDLFHHLIYMSDYEESDVRVNWLKAFARFAEDEKLDGSVAECGVYRGDFSIYINRFFAKKKLYMFDTFEGFTKHDVKIEREMAKEEFLNGEFNRDDIFNNTGIDVVLSRMPYQEQCIIKKGYFPESAVGLEDEKFCFVNLDMDLYQPQLAGLRFFYDRMVRGGVILLHDYYHPQLPGVKIAVNEFREERKAENPALFPIGDGCSIAVIKR